MQRPGERVLELIRAQSMEKGYCTRCNAYMADRLGMDRDEVRHQLMELVRLKRISIVTLVDRNGFRRRKITIGGNR